MATATRGGLSLATVMALRANNPSISFSGVGVEPAAYTWLTTNRPGTAYPSTPPEPQTPITALPAGITPEPSPEETPAAAPDLGGSGSAAPALGSIANSPEWLAYLNSLGLERNQFEADIQRQRGLAQSNAEQQLGQLGPQYDQQRRGITGQMEGRGMQQSGQLLQGLARSRAAQGQAQSTIQNTLANTLSGLQTQVANKAATLNQQQNSQQAAMLGRGFTP